MAKKAEVDEIRLVLHEIVQSAAFEYHAANTHPRHRPDLVNLGRFIHETSAHAYRNSAGQLSQALDGYEPDGPDRNIGGWDRVDAVLAACKSGTCPTSCPVQSAVVGALNGLARTTPRR